MICSSYNPTDFIQFNDLYIPIVNSNSENFRIVVNNKYLKLRHEDFSPENGYVFIAGSRQQYLVAVDRITRQVIIFDIEKGGRLSKFELSPDYKVAPRFGENLIWNLDSKTRGGPENYFIQNMTLTGKLEDHIEIPDTGQSNWEFRRAFMWNNDTYICYDRISDDKRSSFILKIDHLSKDGSETIPSLISAIQLSPPGAIFFIASFWKPLIFVKKIFNSDNFITVYSFLQMNEEMQKEVENCKVIGKTSENLFKLTDFLMNGEVSAECTANKKDELLIYKYNGDGVQYEFPFEIDHNDLNVVWLGNEVNKMKFLVKNRDQGQKLFICDFKEGVPKIECPRNFDIKNSNETHFIDSRKGSIVALSDEEGELHPILECSEFESCETCTMLGYYNPCVWDGLKCIDKLPDSENYQCFNFSSAEYKDRGDNETQVIITLPYKSREDFGEKVYLELADGRELMVSYISDQYLATVKNFSPLNFSININRSTGGPMRISMPIHSIPPVRRFALGKNIFYLILGIISLMAIGTLFYITKTRMRVPSTPQKSKNSKEETPPETVPETPPETLPETPPENSDVSGSDETIKKPNHEQVKRP